MGMWLERMGVGRDSPVGAQLVGEDQTVAKIEQLGKEKCITRILTFSSTVQRSVSIFMVSGLLTGTI